MHNGRLRVPEVWCFVVRSRSAGPASSRRSTLPFMESELPFRMLQANDATDNQLASAAAAALGAAGGRQGGRWSSGGSGSGSSGAGSSRTDSSGAGTGSGAMSTGSTFNGSSNPLA